MRHADQAAHPAAPAETGPDAAFECVIMQRPARRGAGGLLARLARGRMEKEATLRAGGRGGSRRRGVSQGGAAAAITGGARACGAGAGAGAGAVVGVGVCSIGAGRARGRCSGRRAAGPWRRAPRPGLAHLAAASSASALPPSPPPSPDSGWPALVMATACRRPA